MRKLLFVIISALLIGISRLPLYSGWLAFVSFIPLFYYFDVSKKNWKELVGAAFAFSVINLSLWLHWIWGVTSGGFVGILLLYTVYYFVTFWAVQLIWQQFPKLKYIGFIAIFLSLEYLQSFGELRFPWTNLGYALTDYTILLQAADIGGVTLLSLLLLICNVFLYQVFLGKWKYLVWTAVVLLIWGGYGIRQMGTIILKKKAAQITIMQPSIPQEDKWEQENFDILYQRYAKLTKQAAEDSAKLIIWPEAAMPAYVLRDPGYLSLVQNLCDNNQIDIFTGFPDVLPAPENYPGEAYYYNAATLFKPNAPNDEPYYKKILVPVGERMPWLKLFPFLWKLQFGQANWEYGNKICYYESGETVFSPQICFEIAFPELNREMAFRNTGDSLSNKYDKIDFLVNITNDAWFGRSVGPWVHGMMTKFRAIENRIQIYRSANTGISMVVDPLGRIITRTQLFEVTNVKAPLYTCSAIPLYFWFYGWPSVVCIIALFLIITALFEKRKQILKQRGQK